MRRENKDLLAGVLFSFRLLFSLVSSISFLIMVSFLAYHYLFSEDAGML